MNEPTAEYFAEHPTERMLRAERARNMRALLDRSSLGTPGAKALRKYGEACLRATGPGDPRPEDVLTPDELRAMWVELESYRGEDAT